MKLEYLTITIGSSTFDLPKGMQIPESGSLVYVGGRVGVVDYVNYHIENGKVFMVNIIAK